jgi:hypothetical protein
MFGKKRKGSKPASKSAPKQEVHEEVTMPTEINKPSARTSEQPQMTLRYVDRPDCDETFADSINTLSFDGQSLRIEFGVTRLDERKPNAPSTGRRYPACRLVLTPIAAVDLINKMQQIGAALTQAGVVKAASAPARSDNVKAVAK